MSENLKPCPFDGSAVVPTEGSDGWQAKCTECGLKTEKFKTRYQIVQYWNTRMQDGVSDDYKEMMELQRNIDKNIDKILFLATGNKDIKQLPEGEV